MYVPFEELPPQARIWIYQSGREFSEAEASEIQEKIKQFVTGWSAHGQHLHASGQLMHNRFVILGTDVSVTAPSGCSIDSSVQFIRTLENEFNTTFFDRTQLAFLLEGKVEVYPLSEIAKLVAAGKVTEDSLYFDNLVGQASDIETAWKKTAAQSWLGKYFKMA